MRTQQEWLDLLNEANDEFPGWEKKTAAILVTIPLILLEIREVLEGIDRRMGAASIKKVAKKIK